MANDSEFPCLIVSEERSRFYPEDSSYEEFEEGVVSDSAKARSEKIRGQFSSDFFEHLLAEALDPAASLDMPDSILPAIRLIIGSITSEQGRALSALLFMQACIKSIDGQQSIRLHKGSRSKASFSWKEGISMRSLDKAFVTPFLRSSNLLSLNADGFMMTRSLAENYPYTTLYKARLKGARKEWLAVVDLLETGAVCPRAVAITILRELHDRSRTFEDLVCLTSGALTKVVLAEVNLATIQSLFQELLTKTRYASRLFEIMLHALFQALDSRGLLSGFLKPLGQMRQANKKHGNIGDIEVVMGRGSRAVLVSWDAKFGKSYLMDELEELAEKLEDQGSAEIVGFVTNEVEVIRGDVVARMEELEESFGVQVKQLSFLEWVELYSSEVAEEEKPAFAREWLVALVESLSLQRVELAPIDEPTFEWLGEVREALEGLV
jgi:hypothetical protein